MMMMQQLMLGTHLFPAGPKPAIGSETVCLGRLCLSAGGSNERSALHTRRQVKFQLLSVATIHLWEQSFVYSSIPPSSAR